MIVTLKNNKNLLSKRTPFFNRKRSYSNSNESSKIKMASFFDRKPLLAEQVQVIQREFKIRKWKYFAVTLLTSAIAFLAVFFIFQSILSIRSNRRVYQEPIQTVVYSKLKPQPFRDNMKRGFLQLKDKDYFMAAGSFERALKVEPNSLVGEYYLTKSYCSMCFYKNQACAVAKKKVQANRQQYPGEYKFEYLEKIYLK